MYTYRQLMNDSSSAGDSADWCSLLWICQPAERGVLKAPGNEILFGCMGQGRVPYLYSVVQEEIPSIVDCPDPDHMTPHERRVARIAHEEASFDAEYYLYVTLYLALYPGHIQEQKCIFLLCVTCVQSYPVLGLEVV